MKHSRHNLYSFWRSLLLWGRNKFVRQLLLIMYILVALCLLIDIFYKIQAHKQEWNHQMRTTFVSALEKSLEIGGRENMYIVSETSRGGLNNKDSVFLVKLNVGEGDKTFIIPSYKHNNNIAETSTQRIFDSVTLEDHPLDADSLNRLWNTLLIGRGVSDKTDIRISVSDFSENVSTVYAQGGQHYPKADSLFTYYVGYRCETEITAFASFNYWNALTLGDWMKIIALWMMLGLYIWQFYIWQMQSGDKCKLPEDNVIEKEKPFVPIKEEIAEIYELGNGLYFYSSERLLKREDQVVKLPPKISLLLVGFMKADKYKMSISEICLLLWPDGSGTAERVHTVINRLRSSLGEFKLGITIISGNSEYRLKIPHFIDETAANNAVLNGPVKTCQT